MPNDAGATTYEGSCFCGRNRFRFHGRPIWITYDHDSDCRRAIGAPLVVWVGYMAKDVELVEGKPAIYNSSPGIRRRFCGTCGTSIAYEDDGLPGEIYYTIGVFHEPEAFAPVAHGFYSEKLSWLKLKDDLPHYQSHTRQRTGQGHKLLCG